MNRAILKATSLWQKYLFWRNISGKCAWFSVIQWRCLPQIPTTANCMFESPLSTSSFDFFQCICIKLLPHKNMRFSIAKPIRWVEEFKYITLSCPQARPIQSPLRKLDPFYLTLVKRPKRCISSIIAVPRISMKIGNFTNKIEPLIRCMTWRNS